MISRDDACSIYAVAESMNCDYKLYHYTTTLVLDALLNSCTFRASNVFFLNDSEEYYSGIKNLQELEKDSEPDIQGMLKELLLENGSGKSGPGIFSISFSQEKDLLSQWITYAKEAGVAIELDGRIIRGHATERGVRWYGVESFSELDEEEDEEKKSDMRFSSHLYFQLRQNLHEIDYEKTYKPMTEARGILGVQGKCKETYQFLASYYKGEGFEAEKEVRLSVLPMSFDTGKEKKEAEICYYRMADRGILRPYLNITIGYHKRDDKKYFHPCLPLKTITIGPAGNQQAVFDSIVHRMRYGKPKVYDYMDNKVLLMENIYDYTIEIIEWLSRKGYIDSFAMSKEDKGLSINDVIDIKIKEDNKKKVKRLVNKIICDLEKEYHISVDNYVKPGVEEESVEPEEETVMSEIKKDFFFTKEGILINKSQIPYIF